MNSSIIRHLILVLIVTYVFGQSENGITNKEPFSYYGISYSTRAFNDTDMGDIFSKPTSFAIESIFFPSMYGGFGGDIGIWVLTATDPVYDLADFSQSGVYFDLLGRIDLTPITVYGGGGFVYQTSTISLWDGSSGDGDGYGLTYMFGAMVTFGSLGVFAQMRAIGVEAGDLEVGSSGLEVGVRIHSSIF